MYPVRLFVFFFFFNDTATTEIYTLSLHDALPICGLLPRRGTQRGRHRDGACARPDRAAGGQARQLRDPVARSEEHTSELQSRSDLVCRLLLEKKKNREQADRHQHCTEGIHTRTAQ